MLAGELHFFLGYKYKVENGRGKDPSSKTIPQIASEDYVQKIIFLHCYAFSIVKTAVNHSGFDFWNFILSKILLSSSQRKKKKKLTFFLKVKLELTVIMFSVISFWTEAVEWVWTWNIWEQRFGFHRIMFGKPIALSVKTRGEKGMSFPGQW